MPSKYLREDEALIGTGASLLKFINSPITLSNLWEKAKRMKNIITFERFVLTLDLLYSLGIIESENNKIRRIKP